MATEKKKITEEMYLALQKPLPAKAVQKHPTKTFLSTIKAIYVIERLNEVFGVGMWKVQNEVIREDTKHIVVKSYLTFEDYYGHFESYGGNDNADLGDAYKGACTDALTKIGSYLGIAMEVFKGEGNTEKPENKKSDPEKGATAKAEQAPAEMKSAMLQNLEGFKGLYSAEELQKMKAGVNTLTADKAEETRKKMYAGILARLKKERGNLHHQASTEQLDLIDKNLLSRVFTIDEKTGYNTANYEYDVADASGRIEFVLAALKERKQATPAA